MRALVFLAALASSSCAALRAGWARVEWTAGGVTPVVACTARIDSEGEVALICTPLNEAESDLLWKRERRRSTGGDT